MFRLASLAATLVVLPVVASAQAPAPAPVSTPTAAGVSPDKVKCHRYTETGSLGRVHKECHTVAEWRQIAESGRADAREMVERTMNSSR